MTRRVLALGYEKRSIEEVVSLLQDAGVGLVADVRQNPFSRKPDFTKKRLAAALAAAGVGYVHLPDLGCTRTLRTAKRDGAITREEYVAGYRKQLDAHEEAYRHLVTLAGEEATAILCMERRLADCHRQVIVERLRSDGFEIENVE